jgi:hypothetical protein
MVNNEKQGKAMGAASLRGSPANGSGAVRSYAQLEIL